ncbi:MAG: hypothetical protein ACRYFX_09935 [Janthinobacterium lividum]
MKSLLLTALVLLPAFAYAQATHPKPQPKDDLILIQTQDSSATALKKLAQVFVSQGYTVEKLDREFLTLTLAPKTLAVRNSPALTARATATAGASSTLRLTGEYKAFIGSIPANDVAQLGGSENGLYSRTFRALEAAALTYPGGQVSYGKQ